ncbi:hypothetical protein F5Y13DRAFT_197276 [Hypoxylon sp. FL1857]|nr:hypothetical protein F5Y13DRAFT_197276 [Hypoxylon sp. FL1857]
MSAVYARLSILASNDDPTTPVNRIETDLVPPTTDGSKVIITGVVLILLTALWTYLRFWSLRQTGRAFLVEDWLNIGAVVMFYGLVVTDFVMVLAGGMGHPIGELQDWHIVRLLKQQIRVLTEAIYFAQSLYARQFLYAASLGLIKISVILMFMRLFFDHRFRFAAKATIALTIAWVLLTILVELLICQPIEMNWNFRKPTGTCGDQKAALVSVGVVNVINHLAILMLPMPMILQLGTEIRYKIATVCIFSIGILTLIFGVIRLYTVLQVDFTDVSYTAVQTILYGTSEAGVAIVVSNCPLIRPVFDRFFPTRRSENSGWRDKTSDMVLSRKRKSTKSSGFTQMKNDSQDDLELGNMGAHRARRNTHITAGKRPPSRDDDDDCSVHRIVVTSETIVSRDKGEL